MSARTRIALAAAAPALVGDARAGFMRQQLVQGIRWVRVSALAAGLLLALLAAGPARAAEPIDVHGTWSGTLTYSANQTGPLNDSGASADRSTRATLSLTKLGTADGTFGFRGDYGQSVQLTDYAYTVRETVIGTRYWDDGSPCSWEMTFANSSPPRRDAIDLTYAAGDDVLPGRLQFYGNPNVEPTSVFVPGDGTADCLTDAYFNEDRLVGRGGLDVCFFTTLALDPDPYELTPVPVQVVDGRRVLRGQTSRTYSDPACSVTVGFDLTFTPGPLVQCDGVSDFVAKDWLGHGQGDLSNFFKVTTFASSYGLAIRWCTKPNESTRLDFADVRVDENRGGGFYHSLGSALESLTFEFKQRWVPDKSQKPKKEALPDGGLRVTAATGHFDVCVGLGELIGGVGKRAFKLLPEGARRRLVRRLRKTAANRIERAYDRDYAQMKKELVGKTNPETGKKYTRHARKKEAERQAGKRRRVMYEFLDFVAVQLIEKAEFKGCLRAWEPKIVATIAGDGSLKGIKETGYTRDWLWWVREDETATGS